MPNTGEGDTNTTVAGLGIVGSAMAFLGLNRRKKQ
ncbi:LPXTG cell wall anchor domain-containing protein [Streptococcus caprae]|uniref:LPXTG cell wall anchor domain-containing protein n=1 Tax=Streptococcus caprae TaxID=1640501 RepID=A0ABV8CUG5_9STRE